MSPAWTRAAHETRRVEYRGTGRVSDWTIIELTAILDWIRSIDPAALLVDGAFPKNRLMYAAPEHFWLDPKPAPDGGDPFLATFQCNRRAMSYPDLNTLSRSAEASGQRPWVYLSQDNLQALVDDLPDLGIAAICAFEDDATRHDLLAALCPVMHCVQFTDPMGRKLDYVVMVPDGWETDFGETGLHQIEIFQGTPPKNITIKAHQLSSDCPWEAEGDRFVSWLWTGPGITHRICLGDPPREVTGISIHFIENPRHERIADNVLLQLNGRTVPCNKDDLGETGGTVRIRLAPDCARPAILGVCAFPNAKPVERDPRMLRACMTSIEALV